MIHQLFTCDLPSANWLFFGSNVPPLIYYSHIPNILISFFLAFFILFQNRKALANKGLFLMIASFEAWVLFALMFWASNRSDVVMFSWLMDILFEPLVYIFAFYLLYVLIKQRDLQFWKKTILGALYLPIIIFLPTKYMLVGFDPSSCLAVEGPLALYYTYFVEIFVIIWIIIFCVRNYFETSDKNWRKEILFLSSGTILLLIAFAWGNIIGSFSDNWVLGDYGLFGMPIFIGFLVYNIVRFKLFNIKLVGSVALIIALWAATASLLSIQDINVAHAVVSGTLIFTTIFGWIFIRTIIRETRQKEEIEKLAQNLQSANENQASLIHFISHEIKGFLTKNLAIFASIKEGDYGATSKELELAAEYGLTDTKKGVDTIMDILNSSNLKRGTLLINMELFDLKDSVKNVAESLKPEVTAKGLRLNLELDNDSFNNFKGDQNQLEKHVFRNLIDNAIKYTLKGEISIKLKKRGDRILFTVKDSGVGITEEDKKRLFTEGGRGKESTLVNVNSTGYGLFIAKQIVTAHGGKIWAESEGKDKGSTFVVELIGL